MNKSFPDPPVIGAAIRKRWFAAPLTARLTAIIVGLLSVGLLTAGTTIVGILQAHLIGQVDSQLHNSSQTLASSAATWPLDISDTQGVPTTYYVHVTLHGIGSKESVPSTIDSVDGRPSEAGVAQLEAHTTSRTSMPTTISSVKRGKAWRAQAVPIFNDAGIKVGVVTVALPLSNISETLWNMTFYLITASLVLITGGGLAAYYLVRLSLGELRSIEVVAGKIAAGDLSERIDSREPTSTEVGSLTRSLNTMLGQIESSFYEKKRSEDKMRRFVSDASHELRTPLAAVRGYGELYRLGGVPKERVPEVMQRIESEATRMAGLVDDLLHLARLDEGRMIKLRRVDVAELSRASAMDLSAIDSSRDVSLLDLNGNEAPDHLWTVADHDQLTQVLTNLVGNVVRYTPEGTPVEFIVDQVALSHPSIAGIELPDRIHAAPDTAMVVIEVRDHGPGIPEEERSHVFERFYRIDDSRSRDTGGTGLGLSIVAAVAHSLHGIARAQETPGGGLTLQMAFPWEDPNRSHE